MRKIILTLCFVPIFISIVGCESPLFRALVQEQEWSENYALADDVICTSPEMIDGDVNTVGKATFPEGVHGRVVQGAFPNAEATITLPEKKSIHKIVIRSEELSDFKVLASIGGAGDWKLIKEFGNNTEKEIIIRTSVVTGKIEIRARGKAIPKGLSMYDVEEPGIQEIELYGFK